MQDSTTGLDLNVSHGAHVQAWRAANPRELLKAIIDSNHGTDRITLYRLFRERLTEADGEDYIETIIEYWFANNYYSLITAASRTRNSTHPGTYSMTSGTPEQREALVGSYKDSIKKRIVEAANIALLSMTMPNGKSLSECTGAECIRMGGWLRTVGRHVGNDRTVATVFTEEDLRSLYQKAK